MHEASAQLVGGTLTAVDYVMEGKAEHALNLGGGLHHGFRGRASGFVFTMIAQWLFVTCRKSTTLVYFM